MLPVRALPVRVLGVATSPPWSTSTAARAAAGTTPAGASRPQVSQKPSSSMVPVQPGCRHAPPAAAAADPVPAAAGAAAAVAAPVAVPAPDAVLGADPAAVAAGPGLTGRVAAAGASRPQVSQKPSSSMVPVQPARGHGITTPPRRLGGGRPVFESLRKLRSFRPLLGRRSRPARPVLPLPCQESLLVAVERPGGGRQVARSGEQQLLRGHVQLVQIQVLA